MRPSGTAVVVLVALVALARAPARAGDDADLADLNLEQLLAVEVATPSAVLEPVRVERAVRVLAAAAQVREVVDARQLGGDPVLRRRQLGAVEAGPVAGAGVEAAPGGGGHVEPLPGDGDGGDQVEVVAGVEQHRLGIGAAAGELGGELEDDAGAALDRGDPGRLDAGGAGAVGGGLDLGGEGGQRGAAAGDGAAAEQVDRLDAASPLVDGVELLVAQPRLGQVLAGV